MVETPWFLRISLMPTRLGARACLVLIVSLLGLGPVRADDGEEPEPTAPAGETAEESADETGTEAGTEPPDAAGTPDAPEAVGAPGAPDVPSEAPPAPDAPGGPLRAAEPLFPASADDACRQARWLLLQQGPTNLAEARVAAAREDCHPEEQRDVWHLIGRICLDERDSICAIEALGRALDLDARVPSPVVDVLRHDLARALGARGDEQADQLDRALALLAPVIADPHASVRADAAWLEAQLLFRAGRTDLARESARRFVERWPESPLADDLKARLGLGQPAEALLRDLPWSLDLHASLMRTRHLPAPLDDVRLASLSAAGIAQPIAHATEMKRVDLAVIDGLIRARRHGEADLLLAAWLPLADSSDATERRLGLDALERSLDIAWEEHRFADVLAANARLNREGRRNRLSRYKEARALALSGDYDAGHRLVRKSGNRGELADFLFEFGRCDDALALLHDGRKARPRRGARAGKTVSDERVAMCLIVAGRGLEAAPFWAAQGAGRGRGEALHARYWYARALAAGGQTAKARQVWERLVEDDPVDYYGHAAWSRLRDLDGDAPTPASMPPARTGLRGIDTSTWRPSLGWSAASLIGAFERAPTPADRVDLEAAADALNDRWGRISREAARARTFVRLGLFDAAREELRVVEADLRVAKRSAQALAGRARSDLLDNRASPRARGGAPLREEGRWTAQNAQTFRREAARIRNDVRTLQVKLADPWALRKSAWESGRVGRLDKVEPELAERLLPLAYPSIVAPVSEQFGLPPYYVYAIMATESAFHPGAVSVANAYGLVQVIPPTGRHLARELGYFDFSPERLLDPATSVYFGSYYLARLLNRFRGQELLAAAGYNAGPHRVTQWLMARGHLPLDVFIAWIPYTQARKYSKRIVEHVGSYRRIYHGEPHTYVRNGIVTDLGDGPNY